MYCFDMLKINVVHWKVTVQHMHTLGSQVKFQKVHAFKHLKKWGNFDWSMEMSGKFHWNLEMSGKFHWNLEMSEKFQWNLEMSSKFPNWLLTAWFHGREKEPLQNLLKIMLLKFRAGALRPIVARLLSWIIHKSCFISYEHWYFSE